jgi:hypothetical protein
MANILLCAASMVAGPVTAGSSAWHVEGGPGTPPFRMEFSFGPSGVTYQFECQPQTVAITETGVTELMDLKTGQKVSDAPGSTITSDASAMGLFTNKIKPQLIPSDAKLNSKKGWDLTIVLPKDDAAFRSLRKADSMSLMTSGWTGMVQLDADDRKVIAAFVDGCRPS